MATRRNFLQTSSLGIPLLASTSLACAASSTVRRPIVIATWDSGAPVADQAWQVMSADQGNALDAVEAGARLIESEISCCVGLGGNPDRDGIVTLSLIHI